MSVLDVARGQIGYHEVDNNITKFWQELDPGLQGQPWCVVFASWCFKHAYVTLPNMDRSYGSVSALDVMNYAKNNGMWDESGHYSPGDIIVFGGGEHGAICESDDGKTLVTIDGNWGDQVQRMTRSHGMYVSGAFKSSRLIGSTTTAPPVVTPAHSGTRNIQQTQAIQKAVHVTADGAWGDITSHAATVVIRKDMSNVKYLQSRVGTVVDGFWGPNSERLRIAAIRLIQSAIGTPVDGSWGPNSQAAWNIAYTNNYKKW